MAKRRRQPKHDRCFHGTAFIFSLRSEARASLQRRSSLHVPSCCSKPCRRAWPPESCMPKPVRKVCASQHMLWPSCPKKPCLARAAAVKADRVLPPVGARTPVLRWHLLSARFFANRLRMFHNGFIYIYSPPYTASVGKSWLCGCTAKCDDPAGCRPQLDLRARPGTQHLLRGFGTMSHSHMDSSHHSLVQTQNTPITASSRL